MNIFTLIMEFWQGLMDNLIIAVDSLKYTINWLTEPFVWGYALNDIIVQLLTLLTFVFLLVFTWKVFKRIFYLILNWFRF